VVCPYISKHSDLHYGRTDNHHDGGENVVTSVKYEFI
jgi:hypothetical protein